MIAILVQTAMVLAVLVIYGFLSTVVCMTVSDMVKEWKKDRFGCLLSLFISCWSVVCALMITIAILVAPWRDLIPNG